MSFTLIKNALVYDGVSREPRRADILFDTKKIRAVRPGLRAFADRIIDARGEAVIPGLIDTGSLIDQHGGIFSDDIQKEFIRQGITTTIFRNPGRAFFQNRRFLLNMGFLAGYRNIFSPFISLQEIRRRVEGVLREGALGVSFDWDNPASYPVSPRGLDAAAEVLLRARKVCSFNLDYSRVSFGTLHMISRMFSRLRAKLHISRFRPHASLFHEWESGRHEHAYIDISLSSRVPYPLHGFLPSSFRHLEFSEMAKRVRLPSYEEEILAHLRSIPLSDVLLGRVPHHLRHLEGKRFQDLAFHFQLSLPRVALYLMRLSELEATLFLRHAPSRHIFPFLCHPSSTLSTGGTLSFSSSPSAFRASLFPRLTESSGLFLGEIVAKMTSLPAKLYGISRRGKIAEGFCPDLVLLKNWNPRNVFVGGELVFHNGVFYDAYAGKMLQT